MKNTIVLGTVRSGTSMTTAMFRKTRAYFGDDIMTPTIANPYGYYECHQINRLNNRLIQRIIYGFTSKKIQSFLKPFQPPVHRDRRCSMLAAPRYIRQFSLPEDITDQMRHFVSHTPFCLKDPRFSITLPFWRSVIPKGTRFLVVFRDPRRTVDSMLRNSREIYNPPLPVDEEWGLKLWYRNYRRLLYQFSNEEDWFFIHDEQVFSGKAVPALEKFVETPLATDLIDPKIRRSRPRKLDSLNEQYYRCNDLFEQLKQRARRDLEKWLN
ncbi:sulfotransferase [Pleurocapsales cyanobacterium LEGE 10410]|nr:sulfotransferase [Pleurocapsales cyanobacterium LEGE 10410]